jgi:hypothetical protein
MLNGALALCGPDLPERDSQGVGGNLLAGLGHQFIQQL